MEIIEAYATCFQLKLNQESDKSFLEITSKMERRVQQQTDHYHIIIDPHPHNFHD